MGKTGKASKGSLKSALQAQQSRLEKKQKALQAAQVAEQKYAKKKDNGKSSANSTYASPRTTQQTMPFRPTDKVLLVGEGNFSFTLALVRLYQNEAAGGSGCTSRSVFMPPANITATAYDSDEGCYAKYPGAKEIVDEVRKSGVQVFFNVDATRLDKANPLKGKRFDKVIWNFPHAGKGITDQDRNILSNQLLVLAFLRSVVGVLAKGPIPTIFKPKKKRKTEDEDEDEDGDIDRKNDQGNEDESLPFSLPYTESEHREKTRGSVLITLRNVAPYTLWDVPKLAKKPPASATASTAPNPKYIQLRSFAFIRDAWPQYEHRMTKGERAHGTGTTGEGGEDRTWEFCLRDLRDS
ncbi:hypothetical protein M378DRAFT_215973 [Amanita muscaria Koide BX008]|uniref:25S rRNA (uridine-N(3))-methyltransferase BMT5-like domain-containing protein n=1 Tax=Amanita muscaria (strain Koide BX008) TaxID=946122 RepID=A0A0C2XQB1_AMAMK|nr:hypothetical protein M378DRAFT_215973 [Amanita muscaria Koide BX008]